MQMAIKNPCHPGTAMPGKKSTRNGDLRIQKIRAGVGVVWGTGRDGGD